MPVRPSQQLARYRDRILEIVAGVHASNIRVFGSVARGEDNEGSDLDLLVEVPKGTTLFDMVGLQQEIEELLGVTVDVVTVNDLPERIRTRVLEEARPL